MRRPVGLSGRRLRLGLAASGPAVALPPPPPTAQPLLVSELGFVLVTETGAAIAVEST